MSKPSHRPNREQIKEQRKQAKKAQKALRAQQRAEGLNPASNTTLPNHTCIYKSVEQEKQARIEAITDQAKILQAKLPILLRGLSKIPDPRNPKKIKHKLTCLMIYGILMFVLHMASRREANREMTRPVFEQNLLDLFPDLEELPHHDTLYRLLQRIEVDQIEAAQIELIRTLMKKKKFQRYLIEGCYPVAIDGTQKMVRYELWSQECLQREVGSEEKKQSQYYVYVVEASLAFRDGMTIPLMSEFLEFNKGDVAESKQDCESRGFQRLVKRLKEAFPRTHFMLLLDGLYANGPTIQMCRENKWDFMIVLQDKSLPKIWEEYKGLKKLLGEEDRLCRKWGQRVQRFHWVNHIEYDYGQNRKKTQTVHVVVCEESWKEYDKQEQSVVEKHSRHVWLSSKPLNWCNVHLRCNLAARHRWGIESGILVEKHHGYSYEHCFSYDWNAMRGYHYLMRIGHVLNVLVQYSLQLAKFFTELGVRGFIQFIRQTLSGPWLEYPQVQQRLSEPFQLRLK